MDFFQPEEYLPKIRPVFALVRKKLITVLPTAEIEHIGSSAINGAISKGDLDILVRTSKNDFEFALKRIQSLGFNIKPDTLRTESLCMLVTEEYDIDVAIQLIVSGSEFEDFVYFRDRMNIRPTLVEQYNQLKISCATFSPEEYRRIKTDFIAKVLSE